MSQITFWVDGNLLTSVSESPFQAWWPLIVGTHQLWAQGVNASGETVRSDTVTITVIGE